MDINTIKSLEKDSKEIKNLFENNRNLSHIKYKKIISEFETFLVHYPKHPIAEHCYISFGSYAIKRIDNTEVALGKIDNIGLFWRSFSDYVNNHKEEIFQYISEAFEKEAKKETKHLKEQYEKVKEFLKTNP